MLPEEIYILAKKLGFSVEYDNDGQIILYTNTFDKDEVK